MEGEKPVGERINPDPDDGGWFGKAEGHIGFDVKTADGCGIVAYDEKREATPYNICSTRVHHSTGGHISVAFFETLDREGSPSVVINLKPEELARIWAAADTLSRVTIAPGRDQPRGEK